MKRRILARTALAATLFAAIPFTTVNGVAKSTAATTAASAATAAAQSQHLTNLQAKGSAEIDRRLSNLAAAQVKLTASTKLAPSDEATLTAQITAETAGLTALKAKLVAETTLAAARADVASIVTDYRVYVLMLPKVRLVSAADRFNVAETQLQDVYIKLKTKVDAAHTAGKDTTAAQSALDDLASKYADAASRTKNLVPALLALQPTDYNANHAALLDSRATLATAQADIKAARSDATSVVSALKALK